MQKVCHFFKKIKDSNIKPTGSFFKKPDLPKCHTFAKMSDKLSEAYF